MSMQSRFFCENVETFIQGCKALGIIRGVAYYPYRHKFKRIRFSSLLKGLLFRREYHDNRFRRNTFCGTRVFH
jgi:hypothetical protein